MVDLGRDEVRRPAIADADQSTISVVPKLARIGGSVLKMSADQQQALDVALTGAAA